MIEKSIIGPLDKELPSEYADRLGVFYTKIVNPKHKKDKGQFFTPTPIAHLMASFCNLKIDQLRILDPGCGTAILTCVVIEYLITQNQAIDYIEVVAYETDPDLIVFSENSLNYLKKMLFDSKHSACHG